MKKLLVLFSLLFAFSNSSQAVASSTRSVVETQVEAGEAQIYQSVETTVDGETVKKESNQPGKLELKMEKAGEGQPTVSFSQEAAGSPTPQPEADHPLDETLTSPFAFVSTIIDFVRKLLNNLMLRFTQHQP